MTINHKLKEFLQVTPSIIKPILLTSIGLLIGVQTNKLLTGDQLMNVRLIHRNGQKGAVIDGDTLWAKTSMAYLPRASPH